VIEAADPPPPPAEAPPPAGLTLAELCLLWLDACEKKYTRKDGTTTSSYHGCQQVTRALEADGGKTTTRSGRTAPLGSAPRPPRRGSPVRLLRLRLRNRTGLVCWKAKT
jgi:hypothetical protein